MRNLVFTINVTADGCCDHTKTIASNELYEYYAPVLRDADTFVYGRKTYQLMIPYWPDIARGHSGDTKEENEFAQAFDSIDNIIVCSRSLESAEGKARIVRSNLQEEIIKLKKQPGKTILTGGVDIPSQLIQLGLVDEIRLVIQPLVVGEGRRLLNATSLQERLPLKLVESKIFPSGIVALHYMKR